MITWHLETRKIKDLKPHPKNPRQLSKHQALQLEESIRKFGQAIPINVNLDNQIIGGHQRVKILKKLGYKEIWCSLPDHLLDEKEVDELLIRLNRNTGEFDYDVLPNMFGVNELIDWGFTLDDFELPESESAMSSPPKEGEKCPVCGKKMKEKK